MGRGEEGACALEREAKPIIYSLVGTGGRHRKSGGGGGSGGSGGSSNEEEEGGGGEESGAVFEGKEPVASLEVENGGDKEEAAAVFGGDGGVLGGEEKGNVEEDDVYAAVEEEIVEDIAPFHPPRFLPVEVWQTVLISSKEETEEEDEQKLIENCSTFNHKLKLLLKRLPPNFNFPQLPEVLQSLEDHCKITVDSMEKMNAVYWQLKRDPWREWFVSQLNLVYPHPPLNLIFGTWNPPEISLWRFINQSLLLTPNLTVVSINAVAAPALDNYIQLYEILKKIIEALEFLHELDIDCVIRAPGNDLEERKRVLDFNNHVALNPLPKSRRLLRLEYKGEHSLPLAYLWEVAYRYGRNLKHVQINHGQILEDATNMFQTPLEFPELCHLETSINLSSNKHLMLINAPELTTLILNITDKCGITAGSPPLEQLFQILTNFPKLTYLVLNFDIDPNLDHSEAMKRLNKTGFPGVKHLHLENWNYKVPLYFFAQVFPNLEKMYIDALPAFKADLQLDPRVYQDPELVLIHLETMEESQLWWKLPRLRSITCQNWFGPRINGQHTVTLKTTQRPLELPPNQDLKTRNCIPDLKSSAVLISTLILGSLSFYICKKNL